MPSLLSLSTELLLMVFGFFDDLDDPISFANTCTKLSSIFQTHKRSIGLSIMHHSEYHKYDAPLYQLLNYMHGSETDVTLKLPLRQETRDPPAHIRKDYSKSYLDYSHLNSNLYFERVILWWAQTKRLHDIYVNSPNYMAAPSFRDDLDFENDDQLHFCTALYLYNKSALPDELVFTSRYEKKPLGSKKRFYRAITGRFLDAKAYQFVLLFPEYPGRDKWNDNIELLWSEPNHSRALRESLEMLEMFDFTSHFLLSRIINVDLIRRLRGGDSPLLDIWGDAMFSLQPVLTPFDILSLLLRPEQITNSRYLQDLILQGHLHGGNSVEYWVECKLREESCDGWRSYRRSQWRVAFRGQCFSELFDEKAVLFDIKQSRLRDKRRSRDQPDRKDWWEDLVVSPKFDDNAVLSVPFPASWLIESGSAREEVFATLRSKEEYHIL